MKLSDLSDEDWFKRLSGRRNTNAEAITKWWEYYDGTQPLYYLIKILEEQDHRFPPLTINWCRKFINQIDWRCHVEGFQYAGQEEVDKDLWKTWMRNDMPEFQSENNVASLVTGVSYGVVGPSDEGALITIESPGSMAIEVDPRTRRTTASLLFYRADQESGADDRAVLQLPGRVIEFENGKAVNSKKQEWMASASKLQSSPEVPTVRFLNRQRQRQGRSELEDLKPVVDAANQVATNMLAAVEHHAVPRKLALNVAESMFLNDDGSVNREAVKQATGAMWIMPFDEERKADDPEPSVQQFAASDLRNFHETISLLARIGAGLCDLSPHEFGFGVADNPASGDGIKEARVDFTMRVQSVHQARASSYGRLMRLALAVEGEDPAKANGLETVFRDPSTPTRAAMADAAVKTYQVGIADLHQARVDYGYSRTTIEKMEEREEAAATDPLLALVRDNVNREDDVDADDGSALGA